MSPNRNRPDRPDDRGRGADLTRQRRAVPVTTSEPAMIRAAVVAVLGLLSALGVSWATDVSKDTLGVIVGVLVVAVPLLQGLWTRYGVVARGLVLARFSARTGAVVAGEASTAPTGAPLDTAGTDVIVPAPRRP